MLEQKHKEAIGAPSFYSNQITSVIDKIKQHISQGDSSVWHFDKTINQSIQKAKELDSMSLEQRKNMPLWGLSFGVKDLFSEKNLPCTAGSQFLQNYIAPYNADVVERINSKGALSMGRTSMDEFAMGSFTNTSFLGRTSIPGFQDYTAGGSSGGSAGALRAELFDFTIGSDTGGSVRQPAAFCSLVGYKPSYGAFSRYGMIAYASSLDQAGFLTHTTQDMKYLIDSIDTNKDLKDPTTTGFTKNYQSKKISDMTVGIFPEIFASDAISKEVKEAYQTKIGQFKDLGIECKEVSIGLLKDCASIYYIIACAEASSNLARYQGVFFGQSLIENQSVSNEKDYWDMVAKHRSEYLGLEAQKRIILGSYVLSSEKFDAIYKKAINKRNELRQQISDAFNTVDYLCLPTFPTKAPAWDEISKMTTQQIYMADYLTVGFSLAGVPAMSVPIHKGAFDINKTIGMQYVGKKMQDYQMICDINEIEMSM